MYLPAHLLSTILVASVLVQIRVLGAPSSGNHDRLSPELLKDGRLDGQETSAKSHTSSFLRASQYSFNSGRHLSRSKKPSHESLAHSDALDVQHSSHKNRPRTASGVSSLAPSESITAGGLRKKRKEGYPHADALEDSHGIIPALLTSGFRHLDRSATKVTVSKWQEHMSGIIEGMEVYIKRDEESGYCYLEDPESLLLLLRHLPPNFHDLVKPVSGNSMDIELPASPGDDRPKSRSFDMLLLRNRLANTESVDAADIVKPLLDAKNMRKLQADDRAIVRLHAYLKMWSFLNTLSYAIQLRYIDLKGLSFLRRVLLPLAPVKVSKEFIGLRKAALFVSAKISTIEFFTQKGTPSLAVKTVLEKVEEALNQGMDDLSVAIFQDIQEVIKNVEKVQGQMHLSAGLLSTLLLASFLMTSPALGAPSGSPPDENHGSSSRRRSDAPFHYISPQGGHRTPNRRNSDVSLRSTSPDAYDLGLSSIAPSEVMSVRGQRHNRNGPSMDVNVFDDSRNIIHTLLTEGISGLPSKETSINEVRRWQIKLNHQIELLEKCRKDIEKDSNKLSLSLKDAEDLLLLMRTLPHSFHSLIQGNPIIVADDNQKPAEISDTARLQEPPKEMVFLRQKLEFMELMRRELKEITSQCEKLKKESLRHQQLGGMENLQLKVKYLREQLKKEKPIHHKFMKKLLSADVMGQLMANERATVRLYVYVEIRRLLETTASHHFSHIEDMMYIKSALKFIAEEKNSKEFDYFKKANEEVKRLPAISHSFQLNKGKEATGRDLLLGPKSTNSPKPQEDKDGVKKALEIIATELSLGLDDLARCIHKDIVEVIKNAKAIRENVAQAIKPPKEKSRFRWRG
ncbi:hypothetical protein BJ684DRAFT_19303 [Piptocephalis cylindrospora]|uniref:Uncharacterized protein n=1 Tax=Piptocephalis cylindrospora TaxID=1907219 RepID=A0A4P9Y5I5_9FUNG|nr:hypothetical protein BJ684DRAFT_19303 [Piptocephalis cylindrospora]|eukprot:RKP14276.1 hypothetical protein BJ684DRAFT_19303 [Piptocephalis cylindrospora]